jgi:hypothetical protein
MITVGWGWDTKREAPVSTGVFVDRPCSVGHDMRCMPFEKMPKPKPGKSPEKETWEEADRVLEEVQSGVRRIGDTSNVVFETSVKGLVPEADRLKRRRNGEIAVNGKMKTEDSSSGSSRSNNKAA